ncbi:ATP-binding protein [Streptomyces sp. NPDC017056]|uniref:ATP-binding protein n=1 Tax=Streptomyces sp. NPDC017056 TaxID=3364973 RepID=UPI0037B96969
MQFTAKAKCVSLARRLIGKVLDEWGYAQDDAARVLLVCSELATNAVQHAGAPGHLFEVRVEDEGVACLIEVSDAGRRPPRMRKAGEEAECGRGLWLVSVLAEEVGDRPRSPLGKTVWARVSLRACRGLDAVGGQIPPGPSIDSAAQYVIDGEASEDPSPRKPSSQFEC